MFIDLHNHTTYSDGRKTVKEVLKLAEENHVKVISITDHDSIKGVKEFLNSNLSFKGIFVPGCEITVCHKGLPIEILAYGFDYKKFENFIIKKNKKENKLGDLTKAKGLYRHFKSIDKNFNCEKPVLEDEIWSHHAATWKVFYKGLENPIIKNAIIKECGEKSTLSRGLFLRRGLNNPNSSFYVDVSKVFVNVDETISAIHNSGGIAVLAHPLLYTGEFDVLEELWSKIDGIECFHISAHGKTRQFIKFAKKHKKIITGGSDFHGETNRPFNSMKISYRYYKKIKPFLKKVY